MKSNAKCWTPRAAALLIAMLWLTACAMVSSDGNALCPPVVVYSQVEQSLAAVEVDALAEGAMIIRMLKDYAVMRDQAQACE